MNPKEAIDYSAVPFSELDDTQFQQIKSKQNIKKRKTDGTNRAYLKTFSDIPLQDIKWLWNGVIPLNKISIIAGDPGVGKSQISLYIAAQISTGKSFFNGGTGIIGDTIILTSEDDPGDTIRPRLEALHADLSKIHLLEAVIEKSGSFTIPNMSNLKVFEDAIDQIHANGNKPLLLIIDPLDAYLNGVDSHKNSDVRELLTPLTNFAAKEEIAIIGIKHLNKGKGSPVYRVGGSIGFTAAARAVWAAVKDKNNPHKRYFYPVKNNLAPDNEGFTYSVCATENEIPYIKWNPDPVSINLEEILEVDVERKSTDRKQILDYIQVHGESGTGEIAQALGKSSSNVSNMLRKLISGKDVTSKSYGKYQLSQLSSLNKKSKTDESSET